MIKSVSGILRSPLGKIFYVAILFHFLLSPFLYHPDLKNTFYHARFLSQGVVNIYGYLAQNPDKATLGTFNYPPLTYLLFGVLEPATEFLSGPGFSEWIAMGNDAVSVPHIFRYLFVMKLPLLLASVAVGLLLLSLVKGVLQQRFVILFWFFNPITIYAVQFMGQYDVFPVLFIVISLVLLRYRKLSLAAVVLGLGAGFKSFPLFVLPLLALTVGKNWRQQIRLFILGVLPYLLMMVPFLSTPAFRETSLLSGLSQRIFILGLDVGFGERILLVPLVLMLLYLFAARRNSTSETSLPSYFLVTFLVVLAGSHFHPQWALWAMPFLAILLARDKRLWLPTILLFIGFFGRVIFFDDKFLTWGLLGPIDPGVLFVPTTFALVKKFSDPLLLQSIFHTVFTVSAFWITWRVFKEKNV